MDPSLAALAQMLKATQGRRVEENRPATSSVMVKATPPQLPAFQIPGMNAQGLQGLAGAAKPAAAVPSPPPVVPPGNQPGVVPPMPPPVQVNAAPGMSPPGMAAPNMVQMPQTNADLEKWRAYMDQMQFARQGA